VRWFPNFFIAFSKISRQESCWYRERNLTNLDLGVSIIRVSWIQLVIEVLIERSPTSQQRELYAECLHVQSRAPNSQKAGQSFSPADSSQMPRNKSRT
jgi:hypothetical protein